MEIAYNESQMRQIFKKSHWVGCICNEVLAHPTSKKAKLIYGLVEKIC